MRYVGGKLFSGFLSLKLFRHVHQKEQNTADLVFRSQNRVGEELIAAPLWVRGKDSAGGIAFESLLHRRQQGTVAGKQYKFLSLRIPQKAAQHFHGAVINGENAFFFGQHHQTLFHIFQNQGNGVLVLADRLQLGADGVILTADGADKGAKLLVKLPLFQIVGGLQQRIHDLAGLPIGQKQAKQEQKYTGDHIQRQDL